MSDSKNKADGDEADDEYDVGYKKPPKRTQFKPGQSGNPRGRPKGTKNLKTDLAEALGPEAAQVFLGFFPNGFASTADWWS